MRAVLHQGLNAIVEGIWFSGHYGDVIRRLIEEHDGVSVAVRLEVPFDQTVARHAASPEVDLFGADDMRAWWREADPLPGVDEVTLDATRSTDALGDEIVQLVRHGMVRSH